MNAYTQDILQQQIENIRKLLNAEVTSSILCHSLDGRCEYKLTFTYEKNDESSDSDSVQ